MNRELTILEKEIIDDQINVLEELAEKNKHVHNALEPEERKSSIDDVYNTIKQKKFRYNKLTRLYSLSTAKAKCLN